MKERQFDFVKKFNEISVKRICEELGINSKNVYSGKTSYENMFVVYGILRYKIEKLLLEEKYSDYIKEYEKRKTEVL